MRAFRMGSASLALSLAALLSACAAAPTVMGPRGPFAPPEPPRPALFVSPFGEIFIAEADQPWPSADWFAGADRNGDGEVNFEEFAADGLRWFAVLDTDRDGRLNQSELLAYETRLREQNGGPAGTPPRRADRRVRRPSEPMRYGVIAEAGFFNLPQPVKSADVNIDQRVTAEEWAAATQRWFLSLDTDRDGKLTRATLPQTPLQRARR